MEQKRTLWIVSAVGVFLLVVVGAALIMSAPSAKKSSVNSAASNWVSQAQSNFGVASDFERSENFSQFVGNLPEDEKTDFELNIDLKGEKNDSEIALEKKSEKVTDQITTENLTVYATSASIFGNGSTTIDLGESKNVAFVPQPVKNSAPVVEEKIVEVPKTQNPPKPKTQETVSAVAKKSAPESAVTTSAKKPASANPAPKKEAEKFWIQVAAYSSKKNADMARKSLEQEKIPSEVFTYETRGTLYYRVRVGPYTTKTEAQYWQNLISKTNAFSSAQSYVVATN